LAVLLVSAGVIFAVQNLKRSTVPAADEVAEIPAAYSPARDQITDSRTPTAVPALDARESRAAILPLIATQKLIPEVPLKANKMVPEFITRVPENQSFAKAQPLTEPCQPVTLLPDQPVCSTKLATVTKEPPTCTTNLPTTAGNEPSVCSTDVPAANRNDPTYGTAIHFVSSPTLAARDALKEDKLVFVLHVSGNFEDPQFT
jgi:hypothetical protein